MLTCFVCTGCLSGRNWVRARVFACAPGDDAVKRCKLMEEERIEGQEVSAKGFYTRSRDIR